MRNLGHQSQQSYLVTNTRVSINLSTKEEVAQPSYTAYFKTILDGVSTNEVNAVYKPYSNCASVYENYTTCNGDLSAIGSNSLYNFGSKEYDFFTPNLI